MQQYIHCVILFPFGNIVLMSGFLDAGGIGEEVNIYWAASARHCVNITFITQINPSQI